MGWIWGKRRAEEREQLEIALAEISARLNCVECIVFALLHLVTPAERTKLLDVMRDFVVRIGELKAPKYVPSKQHQIYRDELSRVMQLFIENVKG